MARPATSAGGESDHGHRDGRCPARGAWCHGSCGPGARLWRGEPGGLRGNSSKTCRANSKFEGYENHDDGPHPRQETDPADMKLADDTHEHEDVPNVSTNVDLETFNALVAEVKSVLGSEARDDEAQAGGVFFLPDL